MEDALGGGHPGVVSAPSEVPQLEELVCKIYEACSRDQESLYRFPFFSSAFFSEEGKQ